MAIKSVKWEFADQTNECPDVTYDTWYLRKQRVEYYLLTSLGTRSMSQWLPQNSQLLFKGRDLWLGGHIFSLKTHYHYNKSRLKTLKKSNEDYEKILYQIKNMLEICGGISRNIDISNIPTPSPVSQELQKLIYKNMSIIDSEVDIIRREQPYTKHHVGTQEESLILRSENPIFDAYCRANNTQQESELLEHLEKIFDCTNDSVWSPIRVDRRRGWVSRFFLQP